MSRYSTTTSKFLLSTMEQRICSNEEDHHAQYAMQLASASVLPMALKAAIELGVLEIISEAEPEAKLSPSQIASKLPTQNNPDAPLILDRILRLLASHSILTCSLANQDGQVLRLYGLAPVAKYFLRNQDGGSLYPMFDLIQDKVILDMWYHLKDAVLKGGLPFNLAHGIGAVEYVGKDARFCEIFKASMVDYNRLFMEELLKRYNGFEGLRSLVDVGGGNGSILHMIVSKYPTVKGINFDLPHIIEKASPNLGIEHVEGDMFVSIPKADAIFMKWILHSWDDDHCLKILENCYKALPVNGKVMIVDLVIPEKPETETGVAAKSLFQMDLFMMNMNANGKERTEKEFQSLAKAAGFSHIQVPFCAYNFSVVEFYNNT